MLLKRSDIHEKAVDMYIFEVDVPSVVENFSNINTDTNPFEVSVKMKAAGNILSNLDA